MSASKPNRLSQKEKTIIYYSSHTTAGRKQGLINLQLQFSIYYTFIKNIEVNQQIKFNLLYKSERWQRKFHIGEYWDAIFIRPFHLYSTSLLAITTLNKYYLLVMYT